MKPFALCALLLAAALPAPAKDSGLAYVSSEKDHAITLVDLRTLAVVGTIPTCRRPRHMQRLRGDTQLMVACSDSGRADLIDLASRRSVGGMPLFHSTFGPLLFESHRAEPGNIDDMARLLAMREEEIAAVVLEPLVQGAAGMLTGSGPVGALPRRDRPSTATSGKAVSTKRGRAPRLCDSSARRTTPAV